MFCDGTELRLGGWNLLPFQDGIYPCLLHGMNKVPSHTSVPVLVDGIGHMGRIVEYGVLREPIFPLNPVGGQGRGEVNKS